MSALHKINSFLKSIFPKKLYTFIRGKLLTLYRSRLHVFTEQEIRDILTNQLGVKSGSVVFVHSSMNLLKIDFPLSHIIHLLKELVGPEGTLLFPCWQDIPDFKEYIDSKKVFNVRTTPTALGMLPDAVRRDKNAFRSLSPYNSVVAIGKNAEDFVKDHHKDELPWSIKSPLYKLMQAGGIIIGIGITTRYLTFVHCAEDTYPGVFPVQTRSSEAYTFLVKDRAGELLEVKSKIPHSNLKTRDVPAFIKKYIDPGIARDITIKNTHFFTAKAKELYIAIQQYADKGITIY